MASAERQSRQRWDKPIQKRRSPGANFGRFAADLWSTPIWWRRARFSSCRAARERKIEVRVARSDVRRISIAENYEGRISLIRSDISRFSGGTGTIAVAPGAKQSFPHRVFGTRQGTEHAVAVAQRMSSHCDRNSGTMEEVNGDEFADHKPEY